MTSFHDLGLLGGQLDELDCQAKCYLGQLKAKGRTHESTLTNHWEYLKLLRSLRLTAYKAQAERVHEETVNKALEITIKREAPITQGTLHRYFWPRFIAGLMRLGRSDPKQRFHV